MDDSAFFDKIAPNWDNNEVLSTPEKVNSILDFMDIQPGQHILDLGTGTGVLLPFIAQRIGPKGKITAVDYSHGMLLQAISKYSKIKPSPEFLKLDFENENISGEYDRIILYCVYPHLHSPIETLKWLLKVNLKENGELFIAFPCGPDFINNIHKERHSEGDALLSALELTKVLRSNGIKADTIQDSDKAYIIRVRP
ncbi:MAG: class I SAM-dependent methyltransferase [Muribaculaceae bacterium]|nr:class I SAM-dependent methyltransferase [Muribaculaceae bacterium]